MSKLSWSAFKRQNQQRFEAFPMFFAFSNEQFSRGMAKAGVTSTNDILSIGAGGYIKKSDAGAYTKLTDEIWQSEREFLADYDNLVNAIAYELGNHEFCITYDPEPTMRALGIDCEMIENDEKIKRAYAEAKKKYLTAVEEFNQS